jgi:hypothetical protein
LEAEKTTAFVGILEQFDSIEGAGKNVTPRLFLFA